MEKDGTVVGVILSGHDGRRGFIYHMAVAQTEQRQGLGDVLLAEAMKALKAEGINGVALVAFSKNQKGNAFWEKQGFATRTDLNYRHKPINKMERINT